MAFEIRIDAAKSSKAKKLRESYGWFHVFGMRGRVVKVEVGVNRIISRVTVTLEWTEVERWALCFMMKMS